MCFLVLQDISIYKTTKLMNKQSAWCFAYHETHDYLFCVYCAGGAFFQLSVPRTY